jgi:hypothetical protein
LTTSFSTSSNKATAGTKVAEKYDDDNQEYQGANNDGYDHSNRKVTIMPLVIVVVIITFIIVTVSPSF